MYIKQIKFKLDGLDEANYVRKIPSLAATEQLKLTQPITFFVGENGTGKSTLLEAIAVAYGINAEGGTKNFNFSTCETHSNLGDLLTLIKGVHRPQHHFFLRAESFYNVATQIENYRDTPSECYYQAYGGRPLHEQSHGESFLALMTRTFSANGLYLLDEPEAALSPQRQLSLLFHLHELQKKGAQFIIATHSPILLGLPNATILSFDHHRIEEIAYHDTESYQLMELFINHRERVLTQLLDH